MIPLFTGFFIFAIFQIPVAVAQNIETILICRFFQGLAGCAPLAIVGGALADIWNPVDRGVASGSSIGIADMINVPAGTRILLASRPIDFRKGAHGLAALAQEVLAEDPFSGTVIVYRSKRADRVKILVWDSSGLVLIWKQLQQGSFRWPPIMDGVVRLSAVEFAALFDGIDWTRVQSIKGILKPTVAA